MLSLVCTFLVSFELAHSADLGLQLWTIQVKNLHKFENDNSMQNDICMSAIYMHQGVRSD